MCQVYAYDQFVVHANKYPIVCVKKGPLVGTRICNSNVFNTNVVDISGGSEAEDSIYERLLSLDMYINVCCTPYVFLLSIQPAYINLVRLHRKSLLRFLRLHNNK